MLCLVSLARRCRSSDRMRYCVRERSVCRIESLRFSVGLLFVEPLLFAGSYDVAVRSSIISICSLG